MRVEEGRANPCKGCLIVKFRRKPVVVEAFQFQGEHGPLPAGVRREEQSWLKGGYFDDQSFLNEKYGPIYKFFVDTIEGPLEVKPGDWVVTGIKGEHFPVKPDIFSETYESLE